jgi:hypothetical protein
MKSLILFAAQVAFCIPRAAKSTRIILDVASSSTLVIAMSRVLLLVLLLLAIWAILEGQLIKVIIDVKP